MGRMDGKDDPQRTKPSLLYKKIYRYKRFYQYLLPPINFLNTCMRYETRKCSIFSLISFDLTLIKFYSIWMQEITQSIDFKFHKLTKALNIN
jgi:hypothetical protein